MTLRLLPFVIAVAGVALALRLGGLLHDFEAVAGEKTATAEPLASYDEPAPGEPAAGAGDSVQTADRQAGEDGGVAAPLYGLPADPLDMSDQEIELLQALAQRRQQIEARAAEVEQRAALLTAAETRIEEKIDRLESLQQQIEALLVQYDDQEEKQIQSLVKIYEAMKPKDAARIFEKLEMAVLLSVIERMKERKSAPVLAEMNAERAQEITLELATRHELPLPRE